MSIRRWFTYRRALRRRRVRRERAKTRLTQERWSVLSLIDRALKQKNPEDVAKYGYRLASIDRQIGDPLLIGSSVQIGLVAAQLSSAAKALEASP